MDIEKIKFKISSPEDIRRLSNLNSLKKVNLLKELNFPNTSTILNKSDNYKTLTRQQQKEAAIKRIAAKKRWPSKPFKKFDIDDMGSISRNEFRWT